MTTSDDDHDHRFRIRSTKPDQERKPDLQQVNSIVLSKGPRSLREVVHYAISSRNTGESKGNSIGFRTKHKVGGTWKSEDAKSFTISSDEEIKKVFQFIIATCGGSIPSLGGNFLVITAPKGANQTSIQSQINALSESGKANLIVDLLTQTSQAPELLDILLQKASRNPDQFIEAAATLNLARYRQALDELDRLIDTSNREHDFQKLLSRHPWIFGSEYSERLNRRTWVRDSQKDFVLRRTADGYIEVVEIKTPLGGADLFRFDRSHQSYYAGLELSSVIGQVEKYIEELDADRDRIRSRDGEDTAKIRAKIIIGRDGDAEQKQALRRFNGHLHRIEVLTFDQLARIARRVVGCLEELAHRQEDDTDDIPF